MKNVAMIKEKKEAGKPTKKKMVAKGKVVKQIHGERVVAVVNFNTPEMCEAAILSLRKHGGEDYQVVVFDNSDARPFTKKMDGVTVIDNTLGQVIDLDAEVRKYPERSYYLACPEGNVFGSAKHMMTVQKLWEILPDGFLLMDSDILIQKNVDFMFMRDECVVGHIQEPQPGNRYGTGRLVPMLLWLNVPRLIAGGAKFFDPTRSMGLMPGEEHVKANSYDTGGCLLEDIRSHKNGLCGKRIDIRPLMLHYQAASWRRGGLKGQLSWLAANRRLWAPSDDYELGDAEWKLPENKDAKIYICAHADFTPIVSNPVYEVVDGREGGDSCNGLPGSFYSELLVMKRVCDRKKLPKIIGFCGYRKYFKWMNYVPELAPIIKKHGAVVSRYYRRLGSTVREQYKTGVGNVEDLDIVTGIIDRDYPDFAKGWHRNLERPYLHPASLCIMSKKDMVEMVGVIWDVVEKYVKETGIDIDRRIADNPERYHMHEGTWHATLAFQRRIGGQVCERMVSAWIDWKFPEQKEIPMVTTQAAIKEPSRGSIRGRGKG